MLGLAEPKLAISAAEFMLWTRNMETSHLWWWCCKKNESTET